MKTRFLNLLLVISVLSMLITAMPITVSADTDGYYTYTVSNGEATITDCDTSISGDIIIPDTLGGYPVTSIGSAAFSYCRNLTSVDIPNSVTSIGDYAFSNCTSLKNIDVDSDNNAYASIDGVVFNKSQTELICYPAGKEGAYAIPDGVTSIGDYAFYYCDSLTSVDIPNSVTSIGDYAFYYCTSLTSVNIPNSVTSIGDQAFDGCFGLKNVYYDGSANQWANIDIGLYNDSLINANIYYSDNPADIGSVVCLYDSGKVTADIQFFALTQNGIVTAAVYDKGKLVTLKTIAVTANNLDYSVEFDADESYKDYDVKVFCWDSTEYLKPLSKTYETVIAE